MKTIILTTLLLVSALLSKAQPWATTSATWHYCVSGYATDGYAKITKTKDTLIQGKVCDVLQKYQEVYNYIQQTTYQGVYGYEYTYADSDKVYLFKNNKFNLLYNFAANAGDYWEIALDSTIVAYCDTTFQIKTDSVKVDSVKNITINGQVLRQLFVHSVNDRGTIGHEIIEKIGGISLFLQVTNQHCVATEISDPYTLRCYTDSTGLSYQSNPSTWGYNTNASSTCNFVTSISTTPNIATQVSIYPNPVSANTQVSITGTNVNKLVLYNAQGVKCIEYTNKALVPNLNFNAPSVAGMYWLEIHYANSASQRYKVVVN